jgi:hypothetical protein
MVFEILGLFLFKGGWDHYVKPCLTYRQMLLDTRNKNIYTVYGWGSQPFSIYQRAPPVIHTLNDTYGEMRPIC